MTALRTRMIEDMKIRNLAVTSVIRIPKSINCCLVNGRLWTPHESERATCTSEKAAP